MYKAVIALIAICLLIFNFNIFATELIPLPEHPRPDFQRAQWINLNGNWNFQFDEKNTGEQEQWFKQGTPFPATISVPYSWASPLSHISFPSHETHTSLDSGARTPLSADINIAWYKRQVSIPADWTNKKIFLIIGASNWFTTVWMDGKKVGSHRGGYTPFDFELPDVKPASQHELVIRVDDTPHPFQLYGKQGYGPVKGIWQTVYLETRPPIAIDAIYFTPDIDNEKVNVHVHLNYPTSKGMRLTIEFLSGKLKDNKSIKTLSENITDYNFDIKLPSPHLWNLDDPFLYKVDVTLQDSNGNNDRVGTYFGMRKINVVNMPGSDIPYIALNNKPVYLQLTLDQCYNPEGYYTYPSDEFMRDEILRTRRLGLNGQRLHVKMDIPRKIYWADRLGVLLMADVPNSWGEPDSEMRQEFESALHSMIRRDYNHPAVFSWVLFNETWGLFTRDKGYATETQQWVHSMYELAKKLDSSRLVEDNSPCNLDHVITDINSWHAYLPGYKWQEHLDKISRETFVGSPWNFIAPNKQAEQPNLNSECGNVWGYSGSTGDVDWSWDYHMMLNEFRRHPVICGWLYTEHHDVINEWNGYYRYDRSEKFTGLSDIVPEMSLRDLHSPFYIVPGTTLCQQVKPGQIVEVPLWASFLTDENVGAELILITKLMLVNCLGQQQLLEESSLTIPYKPWMSQQIQPLKVSMPAQSGLAVLSIELKSLSGKILHRNFTAFFISNGTFPCDEMMKQQSEKLRVLRIAPQKFHLAQWSLRQWNVFNGLKVNGAGSGYFEYVIPLPKNLLLDQIATASFILEASAKQLYGKDRHKVEKINGDYMLGRGSHDPSLNRNAYPMTDTVKFPSAVTVFINEIPAGVFELQDDPADHRGILSWFSQKRDGYLNEAGSYGYLINAIIPAQALSKVFQQEKFIVRLQVDDSLPGGLAIYGERFGRYPLDPTVCFVLK